MTLSDEELLGMRSTLDRFGYGGYGDLRYLMYGLAVYLDARCIVETGLSRAVSARIWLAALSQLPSPEYRVLHTYDINREYCEPFEKEVRADGSWTCTWEVHYEDTTQSADRSYLRPRGIDLLYLDSDHSYQTVRAELDNFTPYLNDRAPIITDDAWPSNYPNNDVHNTFRDPRAPKGWPTNTYWAFRDWRDQHPEWRLTLLAPNNSEGFAMLTRKRPV